MKYFSKLIVVFCKHDQASVLWEEDTSTKKMLANDWPVASLWDIFLAGG